MPDRYSRTRSLLGDENLEKLWNSHVAVFGAGGVGGGAIEALARSGIGRIDVVDNDVFDETNLNRQILATEDTIGRYKTDVAEERIHAIDPDIKVGKYTMFYLPETADRFDFTGVDYIVDAIDTMSAKTDIILKAQSLGIPVISAMGCGNRIDPSKLRAADIFDTSMDPMARAMRKEMRKHGVKALEVVYSVEEPMKARSGEEPRPGKKSVPGSTAFVPPAAGMLMASVVVRNIIKF
jgi:tRNA A37 threonylcarbamoyladenosine dehydratase